jgi:hypothetical protein
MTDVPLPPGRVAGGAVRLWHVSEAGDIRRFTPRPRPPGAAVGPACVWALADSHLPHYLVPRDCPRVCLRSGPGTTQEDRDRFFGGTVASVLVFVEPGWVQRCEHTPLWLYALPDAPFVLDDANAGYWVSHVDVEPVQVLPVRRPLQMLAARGAELRRCDDLRELAAAALRSTVSMSAIQLRNAASRPGDLERGPAA